MHTRDEAALIEPFRHLVLLHILGQKTAGRVTARELSGGGSLAGHHPLNARADSLRPGEVFGQTRHGRHYAVKEVLWC